MSETQVLNRQSVRKKLKYSTNTKFEFNQKVANLHLASFYSEVNTASAKADLDYDFKTVKSNRRNESQISM
jgi:hypothetical protein